MTSLKSSSHPPHVYDPTAYGQVVLEYVGRVLRQAREARNLSQQEVADLTGVPATSISQLELGHHWMRVENLLHYAQAVGVAYAALWPPDPTARMPADPQDPLWQGVRQLRRRPTGATEAVAAFLQLDTPTSPCPLHQVPK
jgi:transcriptional regulator with XRE-family HTH domain